MEGDRDSDFDHLSVKELVKIIFTIVPCTSDNEHRLLFLLKEIYSDANKGFLEKKKYIYRKKRIYTLSIFNLLCEFKFCSQR